MTHFGKLIITTKNQDDFNDIVQVDGSLQVELNAKFNAPNLERVMGNVWLGDLSSLRAPKLRSVQGYIYICQSCEFEAPLLKKEQSR